jgi:hypothetical protein
VDSPELGEAGIDGGGAVTVARVSALACRERRGERGKVRLGFLGSGGEAL